MGIAALDYTYDVKDETTHWRIWYLVDKIRAVMVAYVSDPEHIHPSLDESRAHPSPTSSSFRAPTTEDPTR